MEAKKILFITLKDPQDKPINQSQKGEIEKMILWLEKIITNEGLLITSPVCECLGYSSAILDKISLKSIVVKELSYRKDLVSLKNPKDISLEKIADYKSSKDIRKLIDFIDKTHKFAIVVMEEEVFNEFKLECKSRSIGFSSLHVFMIQKVDDHDQILNHFKTTFNNIFEDQLFRLFTSTSSEIINKFLETRQNIENIPKNLKNLCLKNFEEDQIETQQIENLSKSLEKLSEEINLSRKTINHYVSLADCYINTKVPAKNLVISSFRQQKTTGLWKLKLKNLTSEVFRQVDIFIAEKNEKICSFSLIQNQSNVYKYVNMGNESFYYYNLIAIVADEIVSEPFAVFPIKLSIKGWNQESVCLKVENHAIEKIFGFVIVATNSPEPIFVYKNIIKNRETVETEQCLTGFGEVFVVSERQKVSNSLVF